MSSLHLTLRDEVLETVDLTTMGVSLIIVILRSDEWINWVSGFIRVFIVHICLLFIMFFTDVSDLNFTFFWTNRGLIEFIIPASTVLYQTGLQFT